jgi:hypothetical protein
MGAGSRGGPGPVARLLTRPALPLTPQVVEFPVASGIKCLALKAWLQPPEDNQAAPPPQAQQPEPQAQPAQ